MELSTNTIEELALEGLSDDALARVFVDTNEAVWRYVAAWGAWLHWDLEKEPRWVEEATLKVFDLVRHTCKVEADKVGTAPLTPRQVQRIKFELRSRRQHVAVEAVARSDRRVAATVEQWDANPWTLNTPDGEVDLKTGKLGGCRAKSFCRKITNVAPRGDCPTWLQFLARVTGDDDALVDYLQRVVGYCLTGVTAEHAIFFFFGSGANGKTTFLATLHQVLGNYAQVAASATFLESAFERHPTDLAELNGARFVMASEIPAGARWNEALLKSLSGGDPITARRMRQDPFTFMPQAKLLFAGNAKPSLRTVDEAMRRRLHLIPFTQTIPPAERDRDLANKLQAEASGILSWAIEGALDWQRHGLCPPSAVRAATSEYLEAEDQLGLWLAERVERDKLATTGSARLYADYKRWCELGGERAVSNRRFSQQLVDRGLQRGHGRSGSEFTGVALRQRDIEP